jgi:hypothetical protein
VSWLGFKILAAIFGVILVGGAIVRALGRRARIRRKLEDTRQFSIRDLPPRRIGRLAGMVVPVGRPLIAPLSGRACVYYRTCVEELSDGVVAQATGGTSRKTIIDQTQVMPFVIDDGTGDALVDVSRTEVLVDRDVDDTRTGRGEMTPNQLALLERHDVAARGLIFDKTLAFTESIIEVGERIAAVGVGVPEPPRAREPGTDDPYRQMPAERDRYRIRLKAARGAAVLLTDDQEFAPPLDEVV